MQALVHRFGQIVFLRYFASSVVALAADVGTLLVLVQLGAPAGPASAAAYTLGIAVHWLVASRAVFGEDVAERGVARTRQKALFVLSALGGLALTTGIVGIGAMLGLHVLLTKGVAVASSFTMNWLVRRRVVFSRALAST